MIDYKEFKRIPEDVREKMISTIFASNIPSEIDRIKNDLNTNKDKSEFMDTLLENISLKYNNPFGRYYEVIGLYHVSQKEFGFDIEEDNF